MSLRGVPHAKSPQAQIAAVLRTQPTDGVLHRRDVDVNMLLKNPLGQKHAQSARHVSLFDSPYPPTHYYGGDGQ